MLADRDLRIAIARFPDRLEEHSGLGGTLLHEAVRLGRLAHVLALLDHGADVQAVDGWRNAAPLHVAAAEGFPVIAARLIGRGAAVEAVDRHGRTPVFDAARNGHPEVLRVLFRHGASVEARNDRGESALHEAILALGLGTLSRPELERRRMAVELLVQAGADLRALDHGGRTPAALIRNGYGAVLGQGWWRRLGVLFFSDPVPLPRP
jgi:hypothetical protein